MKATINGVPVGYDTPNNIGFNSSGAMYLFDGSIGQEVAFQSEGSSHKGIIVRINGKPYGSNEQVTYISVADLNETWINDDGDVVPVTYSLRVNEFELVEELPKL